MTKQAKRAAPDRYVVLRPFKDVPKGATPARFLWNLASSLAERAGGRFSQAEILSSLRSLEQRQLLTFSRGADGSFECRLDRQRMPPAELARLLGEKPIRSNLRNIEFRAEVDIKIVETVSLSSGAAGECCAASQRLDCKPIARSSRAPTSVHIAA